jgi:branched-chain amino acid transport system substrate-binding protein
MFDLKFSSKQILFSILLSLLFLLPSKILHAQEVSTKIGVILPLTGGAASNGEAIRNSITLADHEFDTENKVSFVFEDDQLKPSNTVSAFNKLLNIDKVQGVIVFGSPTALAVAPIAEQKQIPMLAMSIVDRVVLNRKYVVKHWVTADKENDLILREVKRKNYKNLAIVTTSNDAMLKLRDLFLNSESPKIILNEEFTNDDLDFRATISKIKKSNPDAVYVLLWAPQPGLFAKMLRQSGYQNAIFGVHNLEDPNQIVASEGSLNGAWYVSGDDRKANDYYVKYQNKYDSLPANGGINSYDAGKLFIEGIKSGDLNNYLHSVKNFEGAYGIYSATGKNDFDIPAALKVIENNEFKFLTTPQ